MSSCTTESLSLSTPVNISFVAFSIAALNQIWKKKKNVLSWALAGTGSVLFTRQVATQPTCRYTAHACACALPLFVAYLKLPCLVIIAGKVGWESPCPLGKVLTYKNLIYYFILLR